jgi:glycosyltransferase involved in cell wall biosynthesis
MLDGRKRGGALPAQQRWRLEGPFDSSYSLALVNRELARAMIGAGHDVVLHSAEGGGSYPAPAELLASEPDLATRFVEGVGDPQEIVSRNLFPPRVHDSDGRLNLLHNYAWEETGFPQDWVDQFNDYLQGLTVTSEHVRKVLVDNGVAVPIAVVGNGVDHWERIVAEPLALEAKAFRFLHVSSGFPRKGLDALLAAYAEAFTAADDVSLVIKTFPNPHNDVEAQIADLREAHPQLGHIVVLEEDLAPGQLKGLYEQCHMLVAPSRAEGFGLPIAEAVLSGLPVLATGWSGQMDFLQDDPRSLIDFNFARAQSHLPVFDSVWADPIVEDLASKMRQAVSEGEDSRRRRVAALRERLVDYTWKAVAQRSVAAAERFAAAPIPQAASVAWVSTFAAHCGIATYSQHLIDALNVPVEIFAAFDATAVGAEGYNVQRCWSQGDADLGRLTAQLLGSHAEAVVVQFNYGFFNFPAFKALLRDIHASGRTLVVMLHSTRDPAHDTSKRLQDLAEELALCDRLLVHSIADLNRLKALGLVDNVALFPHGVLETAQPEARPELRRDEPIIASYGFFLPDKGLPELIEAFAVLRERGFKGRLRMVNAQFPAPISASLILEARRLIQARGLQGHVELHTDFLSDEQSLALLAPARLVVYPYQATAESASGAVRYGLASRLPVVTSPLPIFDDVRDAVFQLPGTSPQDIAQGISDVLDQLERNNPKARQVLDRAEAWRENHVYARLGRRLGNMINALVRQRQV